MDKSDFFVVNGGRYQESIFDEDRRITYAEYRDEMYNDTPYKTMYEEIKDRYNDRHYYGKYADRFPEAVKGWKNREISQKYIMTMLTLEAYQNKEFDPLETKNCLFKIMLPYIDDYSVLCNAPEMESLEYAALGYGYLVQNQDDRGTCAEIQKAYVNMVEKVFSVSVRDMLKNHKEDRMLAFQLLPADKRQEIISQNGLTVDELIEVIESEPCKAVRDEAWKRYDEIPDPEQEKIRNKGLDR